MSSISKTNEINPFSFEKIYDPESLLSPLFPEEDSRSSEPSHKAQSPQNQPYILVGDPDIEASLKEKLVKQGIPAQLRSDAMLWTRDCRVIRPDGVHLLPSSFSYRDQKYRDFFYSLLPREMLHFYEDELCFVGGGSAKKSYEAAIATAETLKAPYKKGISCIEGGNCQIFTGSDGQPKAIIGYNTLLLSFICLYVDSYFHTTHVDRLDAYKEEHKTTPIDPDRLRIAKNVYLCLLENQSFDPSQDPEDPEDPLWTEIAREIEGMLTLTKQEIAADLEIPLERIAFIFQERFHIDMELFSISRPEGDLVFLHDEKYMLDVQQDIDPDSRKAPFLLTKTLPYSLSHIQINQRIVEYNIEELKKIDCKAIRVPGVLTAQYNEGDEILYSYVIENWMNDDYFPLQGLPNAVKVLKTHLYRGVANFMNGLYFSSPSPCFITSAPPKGSLVVDKLTRAFKKAVHEACPELKISFIREFLPELLILNSGSLHCVANKKD